MSDDFFGTPDTAGIPMDGPQDMDALFERQVSMDDVRRVEADSLRPVGTYITQGLAMQHEVEGELGYNGEPNPRKGRSVFRFYGPATLTVADEKQSLALKAPIGQEIKGYFTMRISPDRFNWDDGSPDTQTKLWAQAVKACSVAYGESPKSVRQVVEYVRDYPVRLRVIQKNTKEDSTGAPRNDVVALSPVKEG